jgi:energy-coupling factor transporter ATP-binding protein EcfA2
MKIKRIQINNYRAFLVNGDDEIERYIIDLPSGENLLLYGENGSGKSSLFKAMKDFFISASTTGKTFQENLFYEAAKNSEQPFIGITLEDNSEHFFSAEIAKTSSHLSTVIKKANITKGFISYRDLLKLHFRHGNEELNLFSFFLGNEGLFADMIVPTPLQSANKVPFGELWKKMQGKPEEDALSDYNTNIAGLFQDLENRANLLLKYFQKDCNLKIDYTDGEIKEGVLSQPKIHFKVTLFGKEIFEHDDVLNEARLTALAISVYLAHILSLPAIDLRILFLDDIFIGLDMSNRIPLIKILTASDLGDGTSFQSFQIFLTTYDREWFYIAKSYLATDWQKVEFYVDNHSCPVERPLIRKSDTYKEKAEFHFIHGDYPACANYLRKALEQSLCSILPENTLYPGFNIVSGDNSMIAISKKKLAITENENAWFFKLKEEEDSVVQTFRFISLQQMITQFGSLINQYNIPFKHTKELILIKNRLLNPLSHDDLKSSIFKAELIAGFEILAELKKIVSKVILSVDNSTPIQLYCIKKDALKDIYYYRFELMENLRFVQYGTFRVLLNARIHSQYRTKECCFSNFEVLEKDYISLKKLCEGIFFLSGIPGASYSLYEKFMFDEIYTAENKKLSELI